MRFKSWVLMVWLARSGAEQMIVIFGIGVSERFFPGSRGFLDCCFLSFLINLSSYYFTFPIDFVKIDKTNPVSQSLGVNLNKL